MSQQRDQRHSRNEPGGHGGPGQEEQEAPYRDQHGPDHERSRGFGHGGSERFGGEAYEGRDGWHSDEPDRELARGGGCGARRDELGRGGEEDFRDYGRGQPGGAYEHAGERGYRHGGGYGGYGRQPGEAGGGFSSGQSYASEPGWGPGYGEEGRERLASEGLGSFPGLKEDICERLTNADYIDASEVSVDVKAGKVTLEGTVSQRRMKHAIEDLVADCIGVKEIDNKVRVPQAEEIRSETKTSIGSSQSSGGRA